MPVSVKHSSLSELLKPTHLLSQPTPMIPLCAGGYAVLKGVQQGMGLPPAAMLPSFASLRDYGNTSCSTTWVRAVCAGLRWAVLHCRCCC